MTSSQGPMGKWSDRRRAADERREQRHADHGDSERAAIRKARAAMYAEAAERGAAAAAAEAAERLRVRVSCPCCAGDPAGITVLEAERILRAVAGMFDGRPDDWNMRHLHAVAVGADTGHVIVPKGLHYPKPVAPMPAEVTPQVEPVAPPAKAPRRKPTLAELAAADGDEGAIDLD